MLRLPSWSIRIHILLLVTLASLPALCILVYSGLEQQQEARRSLTQISARQALSLASLQERATQEAQQLLTVLAEIPQIRRQDGHACSEIFAEFLRRHPNYDNVMATAPNGDFYASGLPFFPHSARDRRYFQEAVRSRRFSSGECVVARNSHRLTLHFALPVLGPGGDLEQVLVAGLDLAQVDRLFAGANLPAGSSFLLLDHRGMVLRKFPGSDGDAGLLMPGWPLTPDPDGSIRRTDADAGLLPYASQRLYLPGESEPYMTLLVGLPQAASLAQARWVLWRNLLLMTGAILLAGAAALAAGSLGVAAPLLRLVKATGDLAEAGRHTPVKLGYAPVELDQLASAFNALSATSAAREAQRLQAAESLRQSEERYRAVVANAPLGIFHFDNLGIVQECNDGFGAILGSPTRALVGFDLIHGLRDPEVRMAVLESLCGRRGCYEGPYHSLTSGRIAQVRLLTYGIHNSDGQFLGGVGIVENVAARLQADQALKESEDRYQGLFQNSPDCIFWIRVLGPGEFRVDSVNPAQEAAAGLPAKDMVGQPLQAFLPEAHAQALEAHYQRCLDQKTSVSYETRMDFLAGAPAYQTLLVPLFDAQGDIARMVGISRDISQLKQTEEALRQAQKLESLGVLAGGIAHDFNNLLTAILGNLDLALDHLADADQAKGFLERAERTALKASELTQQMLAYSGKGHFVIKPHDLNQVVEEMTHLLEVSISKKAALRFFMAPELPTFEADSAQIQQVIMNLVTNASEAIADRAGTITLSTRAQDLDARTIASSFPSPSHELQPGRFVVLEVADTGCGMPAPVLERIFDPFFSTKQSGRGLGLSAMLGILRGHHAGIQIQSEPGAGSTFRIFFPASTHRCAPEPNPAADPGLSLRGTVLVVDDEASILETLEAALDSMGFTVFTARDGLEAVTRYQQDSADIDLVLMDLTMPRLDGLEAFLAMRNIRPDARVILSSGYNKQESLQPFVDKGLAGFIQKPYLLKDLRAVIQASLGQPPAGPAVPH